MTMMRKTVLFISSLILIGAATASESTPVEVVQSASDEMLAALDGKRDYYREHPDEVYPVIDKILLPRFDRTFAAQQVLKKHWRTATPEQRERFIEAFYRLLMKNYAARVVDFQKDQLRILPARAEATGPIDKVQTEVVLDDGTTARVDYVLRQKDGAWRVFDVYVEGVSYVVSYREEFNTEISQKGLEATIERLEADAAKEGPCCAET
jgi:phospholipid transport system substrate-binding protein